MSKIKVAFFSDVLVEDLDGAMRTMFQILNRIDHAKFEFVIFCGLPPKGEIGCEVVELPSVPIPLVKGYRMVLPFLCQERLHRKLSEFAPDVIHFASPSLLAGFVNEYGRENNIPVVTIYHTHFISYVKYYLRHFRSLIPYVTRFIQQRTFEIYSKPQLVLVPTREIMKELKHDCNLNSGNLVLWQRGLNNEIFNPTKNNRYYLQGLTGNANKNILFASRLVWEKNLQLLIDIYKLSRRRGEKLNFIIAGDGKARKEMERQMGGAIFLGEVDHTTLSKLYASSDVFLFPSDTESYGNVLIEAMASGCPCVAANVGGHTDFMTHETNGILCPPDNAALFLSGVHRLLNESHLRQRIIQNGLDFTSSLKWNPLVEKYFNHLKYLKGHSALSITEDYPIAVG